MYIALFRIFVLVQGLIGVLCAIICPVIYLTLDPFRGPIGDF